MNYSVCSYAQILKNCRDVNGEAIIREKGEKIFTDNEGQVLKNKHNSVKILSDTQKNNATLTGQGDMDLQDPENKINTVLKDFT